MQLTVGGERGREREPSLSDFPYPFSLCEMGLCQDSHFYAGLRVNSCGLNKICVHVRNE